MSAAEDAGDRRGPARGDRVSRCTSTSTTREQSRTGSRRRRSSGSTLPASSRRSSSSVDGTLTVALVPVEAHLDLRALGKRTALAEPRRRRACDRLRDGRDQPARPAEAAADDRATSRRSSFDDPVRERRPARSRRSSLRRPTSWRLTRAAQDRRASLPRVSTDDDRVPVELHIVSDSTGETAARLVARARGAVPRPAVRGDPASARRERRGSAHRGRSRRAGGRR